MKSHTRGSKLCNASDRTKTSTVSHMRSPDKSRIMCTTKGVFDPPRKKKKIIMFTFRASHPSYSSCPFPSAFYNLTSPRILTRCQHVFIAIVIFYSTNASTFSLRIPFQRPVPTPLNRCPSQPIPCPRRLAPATLKPIPCRRHRRPGKTMTTI